MFRFSKDDFIASKCQEKATALLEDLLKHSVVEHCPEIEKFFDENVKTYEFLEELPGLSIKHDHPIVMPCIPYNSSDYHAEVLEGPYSIY